MASCIVHRASCIVHHTYKQTNNNNYGSVRFGTVPALTPEDSGWHLAAAAAVATARRGQVEPFLALLLRALAVAGLGRRFALDLLLFVFGTIHHGGAIHVRARRLVVVLLLWLDRLFEGQKGFLVHKGSQHV